MYEEIKPTFAKLSAVVALASDEKGVPFLGVTLQSIIENANPDNNYDVVILSDGITPQSTDRIIARSHGHPNVSVRVVPMESFLDVHRKDFSIGRFPAATYLRFFIPTMFRNYEKVLYLDTDIILREDVAHLWNEELGEGYWLGAIRSWAGEILMRADFPESSLWKKVIEKDVRAKEILGWKNNEPGFCAGALLFNIPQMCSDNVQQKLIAENVRMRQLLGHSWGADNDILVHVCASHVRFLPYKWHITIDGFPLMELSGPIIPEEDHREYQKACCEPALIHYNGVRKPWLDTSTHWADEWWKYARLSPFYEQIIYRSLQHHFNHLLLEQRKLPSLLRKYRILRLFRLLSIGNRRKKLEKKLSELKARISHIKNPFLD